MILKAKNIKKSFYQPTEVKILDGLDFEVEAGGTVAIMGRSGEGKSTLLHILGTIEDACSGSLTIVGQDVSRSSKNLLRQQHIGFIFQSFHLLEDFTVLENVLFPARIARRPADTAQGMALLESVGLVDRAHFLAKQLSGGEKQRTAIARALCNNPEIILADEPSGNLDTHTAETIHDLLLRLAGDHGKTLIIVTHNQQLAGLCKKQYTLSSGKLTN